MHTMTLARGTLRRDWRVLFLALAAAAGLLCSSWSTAPTMVVHADEWCDTCPDGPPPLPVLS